MHEIEAYRCLATLYIKIKGMPTRERGAMRGWCAMTQQCDGGQRDRLVCGNR